eukprot:3044064-Rhodomonas_salina.1
MSQCLHPPSAPPSQLAAFATMLAQSWRLADEIHASLCPPPCPTFLRLPVPSSTLRHPPPPSSSTLEHAPSTLLHPPQASCTLLRPPASSSTRCHPLPPGARQHFQSATTAERACVT